MLEGVQSVKPEGEAVRAPRRLQRRPAEMKRWIVEETFVPGASVAKVARRHGVNANQVFEWRKLYREGRLVPERHAGPGLIRVGVIDHAGSLRPVEPPASPPPPPPSPREAPVMQLGRTPDSSRIEIVLPNGFKVRVEGEVDGGALTQVLVTIRELA